MSDPNRRLISFHDFVRAGLLLVLGTLTIILPEKYWYRVSRTFGYLIRYLPSSELRNDAARLRDAFPENPQLFDTDEALCKKVAMQLDDYMRMMDQNLLSKWQPKIDIVGAEHVTEGLRLGKGVLLWITPFAYSDLISKLGIAQAGFLANHLSRPGHGFSNTRVGVLTLNKLRTRVEDRYIQSRIMIDHGTEKSAMVEMQHKLRKNQIVSITVGAQARRSTLVDIGAAQCKIAGGAISLSQKTGAALLPVFAIATESGDFVVTIEAAIDTAEVKIETALQYYVAVLASYVGHNPIHWRGIRDCIDIEDQ